jgi:hypothetical protein
MIPSVLYGTVNRFLGLNVYPGHREREKREKATRTSLLIPAHLSIQGGAPKGSRIMLTHQHAKLYLTAPGMLVFEPELKTAVSG